MSNRLANAIVLLVGLNYSDKSGTKAQIITLLQQFDSLRIKKETFVFNHGAQQQLLQIVGTIPIQYQSTQYNIPISIWLPLNFPTQCPMCYVTPTSNMSLRKNHMYMDTAGFIFHPYIHSWNASSSSLLELVWSLCRVFGEQPPVFAKSSRQHTQTTQVHQKAVIPNKKTLKIRAALRNIVYKLHSNSLHISTNDFVLFHSVLVDSTDLFEVLCSFIYGHLVDIDLRMSAVQITLKWMTKYWKYDFEPNIALMQSILKSKDKYSMNINEVTDDRYFSLFTHCKDGDELKGMIKRIISLFSASSNKYIPDALVNTVIVYINFSDILYKIVCLKFDEIIQNNQQKHEKNNTMWNENYNFMNGSVEFIAQQITLWNCKKFEKITKRMLIAAASDESGAVMQNDGLWDWVQCFIERADVDLDKLMQIAQCLLAQNDVYSCGVIFDALTESELLLFYTLKDESSKIYDELCDVYNKGNVRNLLLRYSTKPFLPYVNGIISNMKSIMRMREGFDVDQMKFDWDKIELLNEQMNFIVDSNNYDFGFKEDETFQKELRLFCDHLKNIGVTCNRFY